jgi:hypothetical protein
VNQQQSGQAEQGTDGNGEHGANGQVASEGSTDDGQVARTVKVDSPYQVDYYA